MNENEPVCFWCEDPFTPGKDDLLVFERTILDKDGGHFEETWFHQSCALDAIFCLSESLLYGKSGLKNR